MKRISFQLIFFGILLVVGSTLCWAQEEPSQLIVIRAADDTLWKKTCTSGTICSEWSMISGRFTSQPTLSWDDDIQLYALYGRGTDGAVWRSTFTKHGIHLNNWSSFGGQTPNPVAAADRGTVRVNDYALTAVDNEVGSASADHLLSVSIICPFDGFLQATATGAITDSTNEITYVSLTTTFQSIDYNSASEYRGSHDSDIESFAHTRTIVCPTPGTEFSVYLSAITDTGTTTILKSHMNVEFFGYTY